VGRSLFEVGGGAWNLPELKTSIARILDQNTTLNDLEVEHEFPNVGRKNLKLNARRLGDTFPLPRHVLLAIQEV